MEKIESGVIVRYDYTRGTGTIEDQKGEHIAFHGVSGRLVGLKGRSLQPTLYVPVGPPLVRGGKPTIKSLYVEVGDKVFFYRRTDDPTYVRIWGLDNARRIVLSARNKLLRQVRARASSRANPEAHTLPPVPPLEHV